MPNAEQRVQLLQLAVHGDAEGLKNQRRGVGFPDDLAALGHHLGQIGGALEPARVARPPDRVGKLSCIWDLAQVPENLGQPTQVQALRRSAAVSPTEGPMRMSMGPFF